MEAQTMPVMKQLVIGAIAGAGLIVLWVLISKIDWSKAGQWFVAGLVVVVFLLIAYGLIKFGFDLANAVEKKARE